MLMKLLFLNILLSCCLPLLAQETAKRYDITVAADGSGNFTSIQAAVNSIRNFSRAPVTIFIKNGVYHGKLFIPSWKTMVNLVGENKDSTIITNKIFRDWEPM